MAYKLNAMITSEYLKKMLAMQEELNVKYNGTAWRDNVNITDVKLAILDEVSELLREIESTWKWWKHNPTYNSQKALYELIDLVHFGLLAVLHRYDLDGLVSRIDRTEVEFITEWGDYDTSVPKKAFFIDTLMAFLGDIDNEHANWEEVVIRLCNFIQAGGELIGLSGADTIYHAYVLKNHRNHERVDGGVMVGKYDKSKESDLPSA